MFCWNKFVVLYIIFKFVLLFSGKSMLMLSESFGMPEAQTDPQLTDAIKIAGRKFI